MTSYSCKMQINEWPSPRTHKQCQPCSAARRKYSKYAKIHSCKQQNVHAAFTSPFVPTLSVLTLAKLLIGREKMGGFFNIVKILRLFFCLYVETVFLRLEKIVNKT